MKEIEEIKEWVIEEIGNSDSYLITVKIEEHWKAYKYVKFLLSHISSLEQRIVEMECAREAGNKIASKLAKQCDLAREAEVRFKELEEETSRREKLFMEVVNKKEEYGEKLLLAEAEVIALRNAINKHEKFKRAHEKVVALEDEGLYTARKEV